MGKAEEWDSYHLVAVADLIGRVVVVWLALRMRQAADLGLVARVRVRPPAVQGLAQVQRQVLPIPLQLGEACTRDRMTSC